MTETSYHLSFAKPPTEQDKEKLNHYRLAYELADEQSEDVFIVWKPPTGREYQQNLSYVVQESVASEWEKKNGERVQWRRSVQN